MALSPTGDPDTVEAVPGAAAVEAFIAGLADPGLSDAERVDRLRFLEDIKARAAASQARLSADLDTSITAEHADLGIPSAQRGRGVASIIAAARRESPVRGAQHLGLAQVLVRELPHTLAALSCGLLNEWRATLIARETACLSLADRRTVDAELFTDPSAVVGWGDRRLVAETRTIAYRLDPHAAVLRARKAETERRVTLRPQPDTMSQLSALLPAAQGIAVWAVLSKHADQLIGTGDGRTRGQIMADTLVQRVTGQTTAAAVPVAVGITVSDETLHASGTAPAWLHGYGPIPAGTARDLIARAVTDAMATLRRLWVTPCDGSLVAMESRAGAFPPGLAMFIDQRDQTCRTPWCDAPVRHHDHIVARIEGGPTTATNGQGLCQQCNHAKQAPGWQARPRGPSPGTVQTRLPTGHTLTSIPPGLPRPTQHYSRAETLVRSRFRLAG